MMISGLLSLFLLSPAAQAQEPPRGVILGPGVYVIDELSDDPDGEWLGLAQAQDGSWKLEKVTTQISQTLLEGDKPGAPTGLRVAAKGSGRILLLMRGLSLPGEKVTAAEVSYSSSRLPGEQTITCNLGADTFKIWGKPVEGTDKAVVKMTLEGIEQELCMVTASEDSSWDVLWAGDMDDDGAPDVLLAVAEKGTGHKRLLLSSKAKSRNLVGLAGEHSYSFGN